MGRLLIVIGILILTAGVILTFAPKLLAWFGHLPGDIRIEKPHSRIYIPITSMIVASLLLTGIVNLILWILSKFR